MSTVGQPSTQTRVNSSRVAGLVKGQSVCSNTSQVGPNFHWSWPSFQSGHRGLAMIYQVSIVIAFLRPGYMVPICHDMHGMSNWLHMPPDVGWHCSHWGRPNNSHFCHLTQGPTGPPSLMKLKWLQSWPLIEDLAYKDDSQVTHTKNDWPDQTCSKCHLFILSSTDTWYRDTFI